MSYILTIDVGKQGGICIGLDDHIEIINSLSMPDNKTALIDKLRTLKIKKAVIEEQSCRIGQHVKSTFNLALSYGYWLGVLDTLNISYIEVRPQTWQTVFKQESISIEFLSLTSKHKATKLKGASLCKRLFPDLNIMTKRGKLLDGITDSICMYLWYMSNTINLD